MDCRANSLSAHTSYQYFTTQVPFPYFGTNYSQLFFSSNGLLSFSFGYEGFNAVRFPSTDPGVPPMVRWS